MLWHREFPAIGTTSLCAWMHGYGEESSIGVENTDSLGAALARELTRNGEEVVEVNRPNRLA
ncbi:hypothetical protein LZG07_06140 [Microbacterium profundi]|uniref:hypothetical protein n=1 Tax=Microbacterium profundi TaxID=450380 RepID=UPI001F23B3B1|nr:hypothetical protein [Microbacterium profundi]MCE7481515.1 hypothetical protein [Microbacterium profundi]